MFRCVLVPPLCFQGKSWEEVNHFTSTETFPIIVKPVESAGSDGVKLCHNLEEAHFGGARVISSDDFEGKTFLKHISSEIPSLKGGGVLLHVSPLENALFPQTNDSDGSGGGSLPLADELTKEVWLAGWGGC